MTGFVGYSCDRLGKFKELKKSIFHEKNGWFAKKEDTGLSMPSTANTTMCSAGTFMALENLYQDTHDKIVELRETRKPAPVVESSYFIS